MFATLFSLSLFITFIRFALAQSDFMIDTPQLVQCQPANITWTDTGNLPYDLLVLPAEDMCGSSLEDLGNNQTSTSTVWTVNIAAGTNVVLSLLDASGNEAWSGTITIGASNDASCLPSNATTSAPPTSPTVTPSGSVAGTSTGTRASSSSPSPSQSPSVAPIGGAGSGLLPASSGALSTRPLGAATVLGSAILAVVVFTL